MSNPAPNQTAFLKSPEMNLHEQKGCIVPIVSIQNFVQKERAELKVLEARILCERELLSLAKKSSHGGFDTEWCRHQHARFDDNIVSGDDRPFGVHKSRTAPFQPQYSISLNDVIRGIDNSHQFPSSSRDVSKDSIDSKASQTSPIATAQHSRVVVPQNLFQSSLSGPAGENSSIIEGRGRYVQRTRSLGCELKWILFVRCLRCVDLACTLGFREEKLCRPMMSSNSKRKQPTFFWKASGSRGHALPLVLLSCRHALVAYRSKIRERELIIGFLHPVSRALSCHLIGPDFERFEIVESNLDRLFSRIDWEIHMFRLCSDLLFLRLNRLVLRAARLRVLQHAAISMRRAAMTRRSIESLLRKKCSASMRQFLNRWTEGVFRRLQWSMITRNHQLCEILLNGCSAKLKWCLTTWRGQRSPPSAAYRDFGKIVHRHLKRTALRCWATYVLQAAEAHSTICKKYARCALLTKRVAFEQWGCRTCAFQESRISWHELVLNLLEAALRTWSHGPSMQYRLGLIRNSGRWNLRRIHAAKSRHLELTVRKLRRAADLLQNLYAWKTVAMDANCLRSRESELEFVTRFRICLRIIARFLRAWSERTRRRTHFMQLVIKFRTKKGPSPLVLQRVIMDRWRECAQVKTSRKCSCLVHRSYLKGLLRQCFTSLVFYANRVGGVRCRLMSKIAKSLEYRALLSAFQAWYDLYPSDGGLSHRPYMSFFHLIVSYLKSHNLCLVNTKHCDLRIRFLSLSHRSCWLKLKSNICQLRRHAVIINNWRLQKCVSSHFRFWRSVLCFLRKIQYHYAEKACIKNKILTCQELEHTICETFENQSCAWRSECSDQVRRRVLGRSLHHQNFWFDVYAKLSCSECRSFQVWLAGLNAQKRVRTIETKVKLQVRKRMLRNTFNVFLGRLGGGRCVFGGNENPFYSRQKDLEGKLSLPIEKDYFRMWLLFTSQRFLVQQHITQFVLMFWVHRKVVTYRVTWLNLGKIVFRRRYLLIMAKQKVKRNTYFFVIKWSNYVIRRVCNRKKLVEFVEYFRMQTCRFIWTLFLKLKSKSSMKFAKEIQRWKSHINFVHKLHFEVRDILDVFPFCACCSQQLDMHHFNSQNELVYGNDVYTSFHLNQILHLLMRRWKTVVLLGSNLRSKLKIKLESTLTQCYFAIWNRIIHSRVTSSSNLAENEAETARDPVEFDPSQLSLTNEIETEVTLKTSGQSADLQLLYNFIQSIESPLQQSGQEHSCNSTPSPFRGNIFMQSVSRVCSVLTDYTCASVSASSLEVLKGDTFQTFCLDKMNEKVPGVIDADVKLRYDVQLSDGFVGVDDRNHRIEKDYGSTYLLPLTNLNGIANQTRTKIMVKISTRILREWHNISCHLNLARNCFSQILFTSHKKRLVHFIRLWHSVVAFDWLRMKSIVFSNVIGVYFIEWFSMTFDKEEVCSELRGGNVYLSLTMETQEVSFQCDGLGTEPLNQPFLKIGDDRAMFLGSTHCQNVKERKPKARSDDENLLLCRQQRSSGFLGWISLTGRIWLVRSRFQQFLLDWKQYSALVLDFRATIYLMYRNTFAGIYFSTWVSCVEASEKISDFAKARPIKHQERACSSSNNIMNAVEGYCMPLKSPLLIEYPRCSDSDSSALSEFAQPVLGRLSKFSQQRSSQRMILQCWKRVSVHRTVLKACLCRFVRVTLKKNLCFVISVWKKISSLHLDYISLLKRVLSKMITRKYFLWWEIYMDGLLSQAPAAVEVEVTPLKGRIGFQYPSDSLKFSKSTVNLSGYEDFFHYQLVQKQQHFNPSEVCTTNLNYGRQYHDSFLSALECSVTPLKKAVSTQYPCLPSYEQ